MKKLTLLFLMISGILAAQKPAAPAGPETAEELNPYTYSKKMVQSTIHDAIQIYYAKNGLTFYFKRVKLAGSSANDFEVIDLYNGKNLGSIGNFAEELNVKVDPNTQQYDYPKLINAFIEKYNGRFTYVMTKLVVSGKDETAAMCDIIIKRILKRNASILSDDSLSIVYAENEYLKSETAPAIKNVARNKTDSAARASVLVGALKKTTTSVDDLGGGNQLATNIATGAAKFLIERANLEINAAFFRRLKDVMSKTPELQKLFPETYELTSDLETYNFDAAINALRTKLTSDLENILGNVPQLASIDKYRKKLNEIPELTYLFVICDLMNELRLEHEPGEIIQKIYSSPYVRTPVSNVANVFKLTGFLSFSLRDVILSDMSSEKKGWIDANELDYSIDQLKDIFNNYAGLLQQSDPGVVFKFNANVYSFRQCIKDMKNHLDNVSGFISDTYESVEIITDEMSDIRSASKNETSPEMIDVNKFSHYKNISVEILGMVERTVMFPGLFPDTEREKILKIVTDLKIVYIPATEKIVLAVSNVEKKQYNEAIYNTGELIDIVISKFGTTEADKNQKVVADIFKYGQFFASVATAESGDEVKEAINAIALPTGSSSLKKDLALNLAVNGYVGYFARHISDDDAFVEGFTQSYGITAPIGFTLSKGFRKGGSLSLFAGVLDVGAIAQYELEKDQTGATQVEPTIEWGNIISPSVHLVYGFPFYIPLSAGIGYQWLANDADISNDKYSLQPRFNFFLCFDIPFVNIASRKMAKR